MIIMWHQVYIIIVYFIDLYSFRSMAFKTPTSLQLSIQPSNNDTLSHTPTPSDEPKDTSNGRWTSHEHKKFVEGTVLSSS
jgi:hypothetical protein